MNSILIELLITYILIELIIMIKWSFYYVILKYDLIAISGMNENNHIETLIKGKRGLRSNWPKINDDDNLSAPLT